MSNVVGDSWKAENAYPTGASGLNSTYLAESKLLITFCFCCVNFMFLRVEFSLCHYYLDLVLVSGFWDWLLLESRLFMTSLDSIYYVTTYVYLRTAKCHFDLDIWPLTLKIQSQRLIFTNLIEIHWKTQALFCQQGCKRNSKYNGDLGILTYDIKNTINILLSKWLMF